MLSEIRQALGADVFGRAVSGGRSTAYEEVVRETLSSLESEQPLRVPDA
jgi:hypothetical protein